MSMWSLLAADLSAVRSPWLAIAGAVSLSMALVSSVFIPRKIKGPSRLSEGESPQVFLTILGFAVMTWAACGFVFGLFQHGRPISRPREVVFVSLVDWGVFSVMLSTTLAIRKDGIRRMGLALRRIPAGMIAGFVGILIVLPLMVYVDGLTEYLESKYGSPHSPHDFLLAMKSGPWVHVAVVISAGALAPLAEEFFFRGQLQTFFRYFFNRPWPAVLLAAGCFALVHQGWSRPQIFFLGICLGYAYERTGNLWTTIIMHSLFNITSIVLYSYSV